MELKAYMLQEFEMLDGNLGRMIDGLTQEEIAWRPACGCNSIGLILFHLARTEDSLVQERLRNAPLVWETGRWWEKLKVSRDEEGSQYTCDQVNAFTAPRLASLLRFNTAVRSQTVKYIKSLKAGAFDELVEMGGPFGSLPRASIIGLVVGHNNQHVGEISYLRGLQRGQEAPPPPPARR